MENKIIIIVLSVLVFVSLLFSCFLYVSLKETFPNGYEGTVDETTDGNPSGNTNGTTTENPDETDTPTEDGGADVTTKPSDSGDQNNNEGLTKAPDMTFYDVNGNPVKLSSFFGKPIVLNFWASWCGPCTSEMPDFHETYLEMKDDVVFLMVNRTDGSTETVRTATNFIFANHYTFPIYLDKDNEARQKYGVEAIPYSFFINEDGYIVSKVNAGINKGRLLSEIEKIYNP